MGLPVIVAPARELGPEWRLVEVDGELSVLELNPFSGADLYDCDRQAVVRAVHGVLRS